jgi:hypothetical protein
MERMSLEQLRAALNIKAGKLYFVDTTRAHGTHPHLQFWAFTLCSGTPPLNLDKFLNVESGFHAYVLSIEQNASEQYSHELEICCLLSTGVIAYTCCSLNDINPYELFNSCWQEVI